LLTYGFHQPTGWRNYPVNGKTITASGSTTSGVLFLNGRIAMLIRYRLLIIIKITGK